VRFPSASLFLFRRSELFCALMLAALLAELDGSTAVATAGTLSKTCLCAAGSPGRDLELLPHQSALRSGGRHQRQHQDSSEKGPRLQESRLPAAQSSAHGRHQDRIHRSSEGILKGGSLRILAQSRFLDQGSDQDEVFDYTVRTRSNFCLKSGWYGFVTRNRRISTSSCGAVNPSCPSVCGKANRRRSTRVFASHLVLNDGRSRKQAPRFQDLLQQPSHAYLTRGANAGYNRVTSTQ
jgi:hypothetical protein